MVEAVIFDWFGTLAKWDHDAPSNYQAVIEDHGYEVDPALIEHYHSKWDGIDHAEHSTSRDAYLAWTRTRLFGLARDCGVTVDASHRVVEALLESDSSASMVAFPEAMSILEELRRRRLRVAVCSNWGWDLDPYLESTGLAPFVDVRVTSAQAGFRKPHPAIYEKTLTLLGVEAADAIFVGDSWEPDVLGPIAFGMSAVHVCRSESLRRPELVEGALRIATLEQLIGLAALTRST